jgi:hypothetical protein
MRSFYRAEVDRPEPVGYAPEALNPSTFVTHTILDGLGKRVPFWSSNSGQEFSHAKGGGLPLQGLGSSYSCLGKLLP